MKNFIKNLLTELRYYSRALADKLQGKPPHKYAGLWVIQPKFGGVYLKKTEQSGEDMYIFLAGHQGAEMFTRRQANTFIRIYRKADKHNTRFELKKRRVTEILAELEKAELEKAQELEAERWAKESKEKAKLN